MAELTFPQHPRSTVTDHLVCWKRERNFTTNGRSTGNVNIRDVILPQSDKESKWRVGTEGWE